MTKEEKIQAVGIVMEALPSAVFKVKITDAKYPDLMVTAHICGKIRLNQIKILPGDEVIVELNPYELTQGRIVYRNK